MPSSTALEMAYLAIQVIVVSLAPAHLGQRPFVHC